MVQITAVRIAVGYTRKLMLKFEYSKVLKEHGREVAIGALLLSGTGIAVTAVVRAARRHHHRLEAAAGPTANIAILTAKDLSDDEQQTLRRVTAGVIWGNNPDMERVARRLELEEDLTVWALDTLTEHGILESFENEGSYHYRLTTSMAKVVQASALNERRNPELVAAIYALQPASDSL